jgi:hypothetical protein
MLSQPNHIKPPIIHIIDADPIAARQLADWLLSRPGPPRVFTAIHVSVAEDTLRREPIDWLFIRITAWADYQRLQPSLPGRPRRIVFLSGRNEYCTQHLPYVLDAHLQPPYWSGQLLARVWNRLSDPGFLHQPLDIFFLRIKGRFIPIRYSDLRQVRKHQGKLLIETRHGGYLVNSTFSAFQARLPLPLSWLRRGWWVNETYSHTASFNQP